MYSLQLIVVLLTSVGARRMFAESLSPAPLAGRGGPRATGAYWRAAP